MLPLLFITGASKLDSALNIITLSIAIFMSRIFLIVLWYFSALKNPNATNQSFMKGVRIDPKSFLISALVGLTCIIHPTKETLAIALYDSILVEIPYIMYAYNKAYKTKYIVPSEMAKVDVKLINERNLLIMIIIFGEGVITSVNNLVLDQNDLVNTIIYPIILFITVFLFFVRIFEEMTLNVHQKITQN
jgi:low temperature requirement protein LtrA